MIEKLKTVYWDWQYVRSMTTVSLLDRQNPRVEVEIREVEDG